MLTSSSSNSKEYFEGSLSPKSTTSDPSSLLTTLKLEGATGIFTKFPEIPIDNNNNNHLQFLGTMTNPLGMTLKPPPEASNTNNSASGCGDAPKRGSRLDQVQAQFRQKLESEKETKLREIFEKSRKDTDRRIERITGGVGGANKSATKPSPVFDDSNSVSSAGMMKEFFQERRNLEMNGNLTGLPSIQTHLKNKRREYHEQRQQPQQQPRRNQFDQESALKPPQHQSKRNPMANVKDHALSPIAPIADFRQIKHNNNNNNDGYKDGYKDSSDDGFNSTYSLSSSTLHPGNFPPSPDSPPTISNEAPAQKTLLPPVKTVKKRRSPGREPASPRKLNGISPRMAALKKTPGQKKQQKAAAKEAMDAENMKYLDKILEVERRKSAQRRRAGDDALRTGSGDSKLDAGLNCSIKRREDEIMKQINQKMAELESLRSQNKDLGDRSRGSSRIGKPMAHGDDDVGDDDRNDDRFKQTREDSSVVARPDAVQAAGSNRSFRRATATVDDDDDGASSHVDAQEQKLRTRAPKTPTSTSNSRRPRVSQQPSNADPSTTVAATASSSSLTAAHQPSTEVDAFLSRPRVDVDQEDGCEIRAQRRNSQRNASRLLARKMTPRDVIDAAPSHEEVPVGGVGGEGGSGGKGGVEAGQYLEGEDGGGEMRLASCGNCGRRFAEDRVEKHEMACVNQKARRKFDEKKNRVGGTDHEAYALNEKYQKDEPKKKSNWREKRAQFIRDMQYARGAKKGNPGQPPPPTINPDYVQCPHCERRFNDTAAERHIPKCKDLKTKSVGQKSAPGNSTRTIAKPPSNTRRR